MDLLYSCAPMRVEAQLRRGSGSREGLRTVSWMGILKHCSELLVRLG